MGRSRAEQTFSIAQIGNFENFGRLRPVVEIRPNIGTGQPEFVTRLSNANFGRGRNVIQMGRGVADGNPLGDITLVNLLSGSIRGIHIANATIDTANIKDLSVTTAKIANLAVTNAKINDLDAGKITAGLISVERLNITGIIIANLTWTDNSPGAGSVAWSTATIMYKGVSYSIAAGNTANKYIYWRQSVGTSLSTSAAFPTLTDDEFMIAINNSGTHDLYYNAPAPPTSGITNVHINDLSANKINTGTLDANVVTVSSADGKMTMSGNILQVKNSTDVVQVTLGKYDGTNYGLAIGSNVASPDISVNSTNLRINTSSFVEYRGAAREVFYSSTNAVNTLIGYVIGQMTILGDSTNGIQLAKNIAFGNNNNPSYGSGTGVVFVSDREAAPSSNPTNGGLMYSSSGAGTWRGSGGTVTTFGPAGPHCGKCGADFWRVAAYNEYWKASLRECGWCGHVYKKGPKTFFRLLTQQQKTEVLND